MQYIAAGRFLYNKYLIPIFFAARLYVSANLDGSRRVQTALLPILMFTVFV